ncbi:MAG: pyridoxal phosphate-dependent aminotransferase [Alphaproteobacteria bacterium]|nr:pyridoxal phosphate-dependent aminotransferase [Alphaproteobacteria bacterium]
MTITPFHGLKSLSDAKKLQAEGNVIWQFSAGEPEGSPLPAVKHALHHAIDNRALGYTQAEGMPELRAKIATHYGNTIGVTPKLENIHITTGVSSGLLIVLHAIAERTLPRQARVGVIVPYYPPYLQLVEGLGMHATLITPQDPMRLTVQDIAHAHGNAHDNAHGNAHDNAHAQAPLDAVILNSPSNPTGQIMPRADLNVIVDCCREAGIMVLSDEIYHGVTFTAERATSMLELDDQAVVFNGFSKYFCMTGLRLGWMVLPDALVPQCLARAQQFFVAPSALAQWGAMAAFHDYESLDQRVAQYEKARNRLVEGLASFGLTPFASPDGAFYLYVDVRPLGMDSMVLAHRWLHEAGVCVVVGHDFDRTNGAHFVRFSYACGLAVVEGGLTALATWFAQRAKSGAAA